MINQNFKKITTAKGDNMNSNPSLNKQYSILTNAITSINKLINSVSKKTKFKLLTQINNSLAEISKVLFENKDIYKEEFKTFAKIKKYIIYIVGENCENENFGHLDCVKYLLKIFLGQIDVKFELLYENIIAEDYQIKIKETSEELYNFRMFFNENIFIKDYQFDEDIEKLNAMIRGEL